MFRRRPKAPPDPLGHVDPGAVPRRWAGPVDDALAARRRWTELVAGLRPGPLRDRLSTLGERVDEGVLAVWEAVLGAVEAERVVATLEPDRVTDDYKRAKRDPAADPALVEALATRFASVQRVLNSLDVTEERLRLLDARLGAAVARGAEVALAAGAGGDELGAELESVVGELGALRDSLATLS